jgi:hypothetical protein
MKPCSMITKIKNTYRKFTNLGSLMALSLFFFQIFSSSNSSWFITLVIMAKESDVATRPMSLRGFKG